MRVRINLRLAQTEKAENVIRVVRYDKKGRIISCPSTAYATAAILKNAKPVIEEGKRAAIAAGQRKTPCAWIEGDLVAWEGRIQDSAAPDLKRALAPFKTKDIFNGKAARHTLATGTKIGFNPKKMKVFHTMPPGDAFESAKSVAICHWLYAVSGETLRPLSDQDRVANGAPPSEVEKRDMPKGLQTTRSALQKLKIVL